MAKQGKDLEIEKKFNKQLPDLNERIKDLGDFQNANPEKLTEICKNLNELLNSIHQHSDSQYCADLLKDQKELMQLLKTINSGGETRSFSPVGRVLDNIAGLKEFCSPAFGEAF